MLNISLCKIFITLFKVGTIPVLNNKKLPTIKNIYMHTLNKIKHKCWNLKTAIQATKTPYALHAEQVRVKFPLFFSSSLNCYRKLHFFNFIGRFKALHLKFNESRDILEVWIWDIFLLICFRPETWDMFIFRFAYFNDLELQMPLMSFQFIIQS